MLKCLFLESLVRNEEHHCIDHIRVDLPSSIDDFLTLHHFITDHTDQLDVLRPEVVLQVILQVHQSEIVIIVREDTRTELYFLKEVNF